MAGRENTKCPARKGTIEMLSLKRSSLGEHLESEAYQPPNPPVRGRRSGIVCQTGTSLLSELADALGLTGALAEAMAPTRQRRSAHDPGEVLRDLAVVLADRGQLSGSSRRPP